MGTISEIAHKKAELEVDGFFERLSILAEDNPRFAIKKNHSIEAVKNFAITQYEAGFVAGYKYSSMVREIPC